MNNKEVVKTTSECQEIVVRIYEEIKNKGINKLPSRLFYCLYDFKIDDDCEDKGSEYVRIVKQAKNGQLIGEHNIEYIKDSNGEIYKTFLLTIEELYFTEEKLKNHSQIGDNDRLELHLRDNGDIMLVRHKFVMTLKEPNKFIFANKLIQEKSEYEVIDDNVDILNSNCIFLNKENIAKTIWLIITKIERFKDLENRRLLCNIK